jgi:lipopolysaccharide heptosyltransferase II
MKILLICLSGAGDILMTTPAISEIRRLFPKAQIDYLVMQGKITKDLLKNNENLNKVIYFNFMKEGVRKSLKFVSKLRKEKYDLSVTLYPQARYHYSLVSYLIGAKKRIGFSYSSRKMDFNWIFFNKVLKEDFSKHVVENNLKVVEFLGGRTREVKLSNPVNRESKEFAKSYFQKNKIKKAVVIHAGAGATKNFHLKKWPKQKFAELAKIISKKSKSKIILVGGPEEEIQNKEIIELSGLKEGKDIFILNSDILECAAIIEKAGLIVSNDTVISHLAAAVGSYVVALFGPTSWENTGPYTKKRTIFCKRPKDMKPYVHGKKGLTKEQAKTMNLINVEEVCDSMENLLK